MPAGGPNTNEGKVVASLNAVTHGALSERAVLPVESPELWEQHRAGTLESLAPAGHLERVLAERVALLLWRLGRVARYEGEITALYQEAALNDTKTKVYLWGSQPEMTLPQVDGREEDTKAEVRVVQAFAKWPDDREVPTWRAATVIRVVECAAHLSEERYEALRYPGVPDDMEIGDLDGWTAGKVRACIAALAAAAGETPEDLFEAARDGLQTVLATLRGARVRLLAKLEEPRRRRILPAVEVLDKVSRYEAHLHRQLVSTLHELEALQGRRQGQPAPLTRVDVSGTHNPMDET